MNVFFFESKKIICVVVVDESRAKLQTRVEEIKKSRKRERERKDGVFG